MSEQLGDYDEVGSTTHESGGEGVPEDVSGGAVIKSGVGSEAGDDVVSCFDAEALAALVEEQSVAVAGMGPVLPFVEPVEDVIL